MYAARCRSYSALHRLGTFNLCPMDVIALKKSQVLGEPPLFKFEARRRNLWVTDTLQWAPEARLAQPANPMWDSAASAFPVRSELPFELVCPSGKRYAVSRGDHESGTRYLLCGQRFRRGQTPSASPRTESAG